MKISMREAWCLIILSALQMGYTSHYNKEVLNDYLTEKKPIPHWDIANLNKEAMRLHNQIAADGRVEEGNKIAISIEY